MLLSRGTELAEYRSLKCKSLKQRPRWAHPSTGLGGLILLAASTIMAQLNNQPGLVSSEFVFASQNVPFAQCHASTIVETKGHLAAAWFGGTAERNPDVGIWVARLEDSHWTVPSQVALGHQADGSRCACWNPVLFQPGNGPLVLFYKVGPSPTRWWGMLMTSADGGVTWSTPRRLPEGILGPIKNKPVELANGDWLCPSSTEQSGWRVHFERTPDQGTTWQASRPVNDGKEFGAIQPSILVHSAGRLQAIGRTRQGRVFEIWSPDEGKTWGKMTATSLPNPNSGIDAVTLRDGRQLVVYNHTTRGRSPLNVSISPDGQEWKAGLVLENASGEYSYPAVIQAADGRVHLTYTYKRVCIKHVVVDPQKIELRPMNHGQWPGG